MNYVPNLARKSEQVPFMSEGLGDVNLFVFLWLVSLNKLRVDWESGDYMKKKEVISKKEYQDKKEKIGIELGKLQRACRERHIPVLILLEGNGEQAKEQLLKNIVAFMDPRSFRVISFAEQTKEEKQKPYVWKFWQRLPKKGEVYIYTESWYEKLFQKYEKKKSRKDILAFTQRIAALETELMNEGVLLLKFYANKSCIKTREEKKTMMLWEMIRKNTLCFRSGFYTIENADIKEGSLAFLALVEKTMKEELLRREKIEEQRQMEEKKERLGENITVAGCRMICENKLLDQIDLNKNVSQKNYKKQIKVYQKRLELLQEKMRKKKKAMAIVFEGWDAAGKGGAIKRVTKGLDPRKYQVVPTSAPNELEKAYPYLWRFWRNTPDKGEIVIFDRSWYGRVMVEPIEGFCTQEDLRRAYGEINQMEADWKEADILVVKFWLHIDKEEQKKRFLARQNNPEKQWKLTDEDWRNREKWDLYENMVNTMLLRTSTINAPWIIVEANSKYYARLKILENILYYLEQYLLEE